MEKKILVRNYPIDGLAGVVQAGNFLFVSGCDGHRDFESGQIVPSLAGNAEAQCENSYGMLRRLLQQANADLATVVRIDHVTSSMDWLPRRQAIRARLFGVPAPMTSTGISGKMAGINMLTTSAIAVTDINEKSVLVSGPSYAMNNISGAVQAGPFVFLSGIRSTFNPLTKSAVEEESPGSFAIQAKICYQQVKAILRETGLTPNSLIRIDSYLRDGNRVADDLRIRSDVLGRIVCAAATIPLPFSGRGEIEVTTMAAGRGIKKEVIEGAGDDSATVIDVHDWLFVGECLGNGRWGADKGDPKLLGDREAQLNRAIDVLDSALGRAGGNLSGVVRLEVWLRDIYFAEKAAQILCQRFADSPPAVVIMGAELEDLLEVKLNAIAIK